MNKIKEQSKRYYNKNKILLNQKSRINRSKYLNSWLSVIPSVTKCEVCGKEIYFASGNQKNSIHFDHKAPNNIIGKRPTPWLANNKWSREKELIWRSCDFGCLCFRCNKYLPTRGRKEFIKMAFRYVFGKDFPEMEL